MFFSVDVLANNFGTRTISSFAQLTVNFSVNDHGIEMNCCMLVVVAGMTKYKLLRLSVTGGGASACAAARGKVVFVT